MKLWEKALDNLAEGCRDLHHEYIDSQVKIIKDFINTTEGYIKQVEEDAEDDSRFRRRNDN